MLKSGFTLHSLDISSIVLINMQISQEKIIIVPCPFYQRVHYSHETLYLKSAWELSLDEMSLAEETLHINYLSMIPYILPLLIVCLLT